MLVLMDFIHFVDFETIPASIIEEVFLPWMKKSHLLQNGDCAQCWETFTRIALVEAETTGIRFGITPFGTADFFSDELSPVLINLTEICLSGQGLHDKRYLARW